MENSAGLPNLDEGGELKSTSKFGPSTSAMLLQETRCRIERHRLVFMFVLEDTFKSENLYTILKGLHAPVHGTKLISTLYKHVTSPPRMNSHSQYQDNIPPSRQPGVNQSMHCRPRILHPNDASSPVPSSQNRHHLGSSTPSHSQQYHPQRFRSGGFRQQTRAIWTRDCAARDQ